MNSTRNKAFYLKIIELFDTQEDFANFVNVSPAYVSLVLHYRRRLTPEKREEWRMALNGFDQFDLNRDAPPASESGPPPGQPPGQQ
jgi:hypothetical protein